MDVPFISFGPAEPGLPVPGRRSGLGGVGGNDVLDAGAGDDILVGDAGCASWARDAAATTSFSAARATIASMGTPFHRFFTAGGRPGRPARSMFPDTGMSRPCLGR